MSNGNDNGLWIENDCKRNLSLYDFVGPDPPACRQAGDQAVFGAFGERTLHTRKRPNRQRLVILSVAKNLPK